MSLKTKVREITDLLLENINYDSPAGSTMSFQQLNDVLIAIGRIIITELGYELQKQLIGVNSIQSQYPKFKARFTTNTIEISNLKVMKLDMKKENELRDKLSEIKDNTDNTEYIDVINKILGNLDRFITVGVFIIGINKIKKELKRYGLDAVLIWKEGASVTIIINKKKEEPEEKKEVDLTEMSEEEEPEDLGLEEIEEEEEPEKETEELESMFEEEPEEEEEKTEEKPEEEPEEEEEPEKEPETKEEEPEEEASATSWF